MPNNVDTRIVEMEFDNVQFERGAKQTLDTLSKLDDALAFKEVGKGLETLNSAMSKLDFSSVSTSIESVGKSFTAMEAISLGVFERIGNKLGDLGMKIADELLVAQKRAGFGEYELELGSVQTIQASTGKDFKEIYGYLGQLNKYADQTIYSFKDMTANIGKFTNAGVDLDVAVKAIQGISNEAALSGANAQEASRAMYNFSQALSSGVVRLVDWKSIENANMATVEFKQTLLDTALELGTVTKQGEDYISTTTDMKGKVSGAFNATKGFNDALSSQWMTSEVLTKALAKYSDSTTDIGKRAFAAAQDVKSFSQMMDTLKEAAGSGWSETFRLIFGEFEDAKKLWTGVSNTLGGVVDAFSNLRNHALRYWKQEGGRTKLLNSLIRLWKIFDERIKIVVEAFKVAFPIVTKFGHVLTGLTNRFSKFTKGLKKGLLGNKEALDDFRLRVDKIFRGLRLLLKAVRIVAQTIRRVFITALSAIDDSAEEITPLAIVFERIAAGIFKAAKSFRSWAANSESLALVTEYAKKFYAILQTIANKFKTGFIGKSEQIFGGLKLIVSALVDVFSAFATIATHAIKGFVSSFKNVGNVVDIFEKVANFVSNAGKSFKEWATNGKRLEYLENTFKGLGYFISLIVEVAKQVGSALRPLFVQAGNSEPVILKITSRLADLIKKLLDFVKETKIVEKIVRGIIAVFKDLMPLLAGFKDGFVDIFKGNYTKGLKTIGVGFKTAFGNIVSGIKEFVKAKGISADSFSFLNSFKGLTATLEPIGKKFKEIMSSSFGGFGEFISETFGAGATLLSSIGGFFATTLDFIGGTLNAVLQLIKTIGSGIKSAFTTIISAVKIDGGELDAIFSTIGEGIKNLWIGFTKDPLETFAVFKTLTTVSDTLENLTAPLGSLSDIGNSVSKVLGETTGVLKEIRGAADAWKKEKTTETFMNIAKSLLILAAAIAIIALAFHGDAEAATTGLAAVTALLAEMAQIISNMTNVIPNPVMLGSVTTAMIKMAVAMVLMGVAMGKMAAISKGNPEAQSIALIAMLAIMREMGKTIESISMSMPDSKMLKATASAIIKMSIAMLIMAKGVAALAEAGGENLLSVVVAAIMMIKLMREMVDVITKLAAIAPSSDILKNVGSVMIKMSIALLIMTLAIKSLAKAANGNLAGVILAVAGIILIMREMVSMIGELAKLSDKENTLKKAASAMVKMSIALLIISNAIAAVAKAGKDGNTGNLVIAIFGIILIMKMIADVVIKLAESAKELGKEGRSSVKMIASLVDVMLALAVAILLITPAVQKLGAMSGNDLAMGLVGLAGVLYLIFEFINKMSKTDFKADSLKSSLGTLMALIITLKIFSGIIIAFGSLSPERLTAGVMAFVIMAGTMYAMLYGLVELSSKLDPTKILVLSNALGGIAKAFVVMAIAMGILVLSINKLSGSSLDDLLPGVVALAALLAVMTAVFVALDKTGDTKKLIGVAISLLIMSASLSEMVKVLAALQHLDFMAAGGGLLLLALMMGSLVALSQWAPQLQALAIAFMEMGAASALLSAGILLGAMALAVLVKAIVMLADNWKKTRKMILGAVKLLPEILPTMAKSLADGLAEFIKELALSFPKIIAVLVDLGKMLIKYLLVLVEDLLKGLLKSVLDLLDILDDYIGPITEILLKVILALLQALDNHMYDILEVLGSIVTKLILGLLDWIISYIPSIAEKLFDAIISLIYSVAALFDEEHINAFNEAANTLFTNLVNATISVFNNGLWQFVALGGKLIGGIVSGIVNTMSAVGTKIKETFTSAITTAQEKIKDFKKLGKKLISALIKGIKEKWKDVKENVEMFGESVLETFQDAFGIESPSKEMAEMGKYLDEGLANGITDYAGLATDASDATADDVCNGFSTKLGEVDFNEMVGNTDITPSITPIVDGDAASKATSELTDIMGGQNDLVEGYAPKLDFGSVSTDLSQQTYDTVNTSFNDETKQMYDELKSAIEDLTEMLDGMILVDENTNNKTILEVDGETIATATAPYFNDKLLKNAAKAKTKTATSKK